MFVSIIFRCDVAHATADVYFYNAQFSERHATLVSIAIEIGIIGLFGGCMLEYFVDRKLYANIEIYDPFRFFSGR